MKTKDAKLKGLPYIKDGSQLPKGEFFMFKKQIFIPLLSFVLMFSFMVDMVQASGSDFYSEDLEHGIISIQYLPKSDSNTKVIIQKGNQKYIYDLNSNNTFPLQLGNGNYTISVLEQKSGNKYKLINKDTVNLNIKNENVVYLQSIQSIHWDKDMKAIQKAKALTKNSKSDQEKIEAIYNYIVKNISYDKKKSANINADYIPSIEKTFTTSKGICYDYSALFAAMLRSVDIPAKLAMGYGKDIDEYHAWNQVYFKDSKQWVTIDTTYDAGFKDSKSKKSMIKEAADYSVEKIY